MKRVCLVVVCLLGLAALGTDPASATPSDDQAPAPPVLSNVQTASCSTGTAVVAASDRVFVAVSAQDPDNAFVTVNVQLYTADGTQRLGRTVHSVAVGTTVGYEVASSQPLRTGGHYELRAVANDTQRRSAYSPWCQFTVDNRVPTVPQQDSSSFGTTTPEGVVGQRGHVTVSGGGPATAQYQWTAEPAFVYVVGCADYATFGTDCTTRGDPVVFSFKPQSTIFELCVRAISRAGLTSDGNCVTYQVNPAPTSAR